jgi:hypothetical protein
LEVEIDRYGEFSGPKPSDFNLKSDKKEIGTTAKLTFRIPRFNMLKNV